jgi:acyl dehydratase
MTAPRYLEDLIVGERHTAGPIDLTEAESVAFATRYDPQPMHIDATFAVQGPFHGLIASGWQTCSLVMRLTIEAKLFGSTLVLGLGVDELRWAIPFRRKLKFYPSHPRNPSRNSASCGCTAWAAIRAAK